MKTVIAMLTAMFAAVALAQTPAAPAAKKEEAKKEAPKTEVKKEEKKAEAKPAAAAPATPAPAPKAEAKKEEKKEAAKKWSRPRAYVKTFKKPNDFDEDNSIELDIALARNLKRIEIEEEEEETNDDIKNKLKLFRMLALLKYDGYNLKNGI